MKWNAPLYMRKLHRWATVLIVLPFFIVLVSGLLLQVKKEFDWIQPPTQVGTAGAPQLSFEEILRVAQGVPEAEVATWADVDRLDVRPDRGVVKIRATNRWEVQIDAQTGAVLNVAQRRSELIESIHDGSWFHDRAKLWVFLPSAVVVFGLWGTGVYLFGLPYWTRWRRKEKRERVEAQGVKPAQLPES